MRLHFDMLFEQNISIRFGASTGRGILAFNNRMEKSEPDLEKYYIHPDNILLLKTKLGDIVKVVGDGTIKPQSPPPVHWTEFVVPESSFFHDRKLPEDGVVIGETPNPALGTARTKKDSFRLCSATASRSSGQRAKKHETLQEFPNVHTLQCQFSRALLRGR
jgi:hypothetical protein